LRSLICTALILLMVIIILLIFMIILSIYSGIAYGVCVHWIMPTTMKISTCTILHAILYIILTFVMLFIIFCMIIESIRWTTY